MQARFGYLLALLVVVGLTSGGLAEEPGYVGVQVKLDPNGKGVLITELVVDGPAEKAGLKKDDIVLKIEDTEFNELKSFVDKIRNAKPGDKLTFKIERGGKEMEIKVTVGKMGM